MQPGKNVRTIGGLIWYGLGLIVAILILDSFITKWNLLPLAKFVAGIVALLLFPLVHLAVKAASGAFGGYGPVVPRAGAGESFPSPSTSVVGIWLLAFSAFSVLGVFLCIYPPYWPEGLLGLVSIETSKLEEGREALITMFGAGVGASITTILGYLRHASTEKNFDRSFVPWYVGRPLMGMLLGLIFYCLMKGGLLLAVEPANGQAISDLNNWSLAGIGALVGLFSKNAIEKLREVFNTMFRTGDETRRNLGGLPEDVRKKLLDALPAEVKNVLMFGTGEELKATLAALPETAKAKLRDSLPKEVRTILDPALGANLKQRLAALPEDDQEKLMAGLPPGLQRTLSLKSAEEFGEALAALDAAEKTSLLNALPDSAKTILEPFLKAD